MFIFKSREDKLQPHSNPSSTSFSLLHFALCLLDRSACLSPYPAQPEPLEAGLDHRRTIPGDDCIHQLASFSRLKEPRLYMRTRSYLYSDASHIQSFQSWCSPTNEFAQRLIFHLLICFKIIMAKYLSKCITHFSSSKYCLLRII